MTKKFRNKYRIASARMQNWDYGSNAAYFITICTQDRICFFGQVQNGEMKYNESGQMANTIWMKIPQQFPYAELGDFVVMPNHFHGILIINKSPVQPRLLDSKTQPRLITQKVQTRLIASQRSLSLKESGGITGNKNPMLHDNISRIIRWYKGRCTYEIRKANPAFGWQPRFYDHIIRNNISYQRKAKYIRNNPKNWHEDKLNSGSFTINH